MIKHDWSNIEGFRFKVKVKIKAKKKFIHSDMCIFLKKLRYRLFRCRASLQPDLFPHSFCSSVCNSVVSTRAASEFLLGGLFTLHSALAPHVPGQGSTHFCCTQARLRSQSELEITKNCGFPMLILRIF